MKQKMTVLFLTALVTFALPSVAKVRLDFSSPKNGLLRAAADFTTQPTYVNDSGQRFLLTKGMRTNPDVIFYFDRATRHYQLRWKTPAGTYMNNDGDLLHTSQVNQPQSKTQKTVLAQYDNLELAAVLERGLVTSDASENKGISVGCAMAVRAVSSAVDALLAALQTGDQAAIDAAEIALENALDLMDLLCRRK